MTKIDREIENLINERKRMLSSAGREMDLININYRIIMSVLKKVKEKKE